MEEETNPNLKEKKNPLLRFHTLWSVNMGSKPLQGEVIFHVFNNPLALTAKRRSYKPKNVESRGKGEAIG
jgi:hypothetical protein